MAPAAALLAALVAALILDALLGEPDWIWRRVPHPAVLAGRAVGWLDARLNRGRAQRAKGAAAVAVLVAGAMGLGWLLGRLPLAGVVEAVVAAILLAQRSLVDHVRAVACALRRDGVAAGRRAVGRIVGRDTGGMDEARIARAALESAAENLSDGVVAPAVWFALGGLPAMLAYKVVNTADSMIGYRTPRHARFGWAAARLDDLLNWIPARLTAGLILVATATRPGGLAAEAARHRSPNAGWPEAAMARALDVALAGPRSYDGRMQDFPFVHPAGRRDPGAADIERGVAVLWRSWAVLLGAASLAAGLAAVS